jgi:phage RecT family recombinase
MATAAPPRAALTVTRERVGSILLTDAAKQQIMPLLHRGVSIDAVISEVNRAVIENPEILEATPESIIIAVSQCVKWDLSIGETVYLVPFNVNVAKKDEKPNWEKRIKAIRDYKGMVELVVRAGCARSIDANNVYENEIKEGRFKYHQGSDPWIEHYPLLDPRARGKQAGSYAIARLSGYIKKVVFLSLEEIEKVRAAHSKQWKTGPLPDWYGPKTCVHRVVKLIPKNPKLAEIIRQFDEEEIADAEFEVVGAAAAGSTPHSADRTSNGGNPGQTTAHVQDAAATAPAAATDDTPALIQEPDPAALTLEQAKALPLFGEKSWWGGEAGKPLDSFENAQLLKIRSWSIDSINRKGDDPVKQQAIVAIDLILKSREQAAA